MTPSEAFQADPVNLIAQILVIIGAINWLGIGLQNTNYVSVYLFDYSKLIYTAVGAAGLYLAYKKVMEFTGKEQMTNEEKDRRARLFHKQAQA